MALPFLPSDAAMLCLQAGCVAAPRLAPGAERLDRFHGRGWAIVPAASIVGVIFLIRYQSASATWLTYLALVAVPLLAAAALGWAARGSRPWLALVAIPLFIAVWRLPGSLLGEACGALLDALSCITLGVLLAAVAPSRWLKLGIVAMAAADAWLVASDLLQAPNATLVYSHPAAGLPRLQSESFGSVSMGYGDLFIAGVLGALLSARARLQRAAALLTLLLAGAFDVLFLVVDELPATVPVALALIAIEGWLWAGRRHARRLAASRGVPAAGGVPATAEQAGAGANAARRPSRPAAATPRRAT
jgi:hypothetical protein